MVTFWGMTFDNSLTPVYGLLLSSVRNIAPSEHSHDLHAWKSPDMPSFTVRLVFMEYVMSC